MENALKSVMTLAFLLFAVSINAQTKNQKTEIVRVEGNCGMCKTTIEKAGNLTNESIVEWDKSTKMATITYDSSKTSKSAILKRIALSGYDNELFVSPDDTYAQLPGCCQYDRAIAVVEKHHVEDHNIEHAAIEIGKIAQLNLVFDNYFEVKDALVKSDENLTVIKTANLLQSLESVKMNELKMDVHTVWMKVMKDLKSDAQKMVDNKDFKSQRTNFISLSNNMYSLLKVAKYASPVYYQHCPMTNNGKGANWLSTENEVKNPYYGSQMMTCGKTVETIE